MNPKPALLSFSSPSSQSSIVIAAAVAFCFPPSVFPFSFASHSLHFAACFKDDFYATILPLQLRRPGSCRLLIPQRTPTFHQPARFLRPVTASTFLTPQRPTAPRFRLCSFLFTLHLQNETVTSARWPLGHVVDLGRSFRCLRQRLRTGRRQNDALRTSRQQ